jgi:DNA-binding transcriptional MerR regulator
MAQALKKLAAPEAPVIPDRLYFKIGDVARICGVETYVLRFWETQFPQLKPNKGGTGQRLYRRREVELALEIKRLVHREGYTIAGARQALESGPRPQPSRTMPASAPAPVAAIQQAGASLAGSSQAGSNQAVTAAIGRARAELREILTMLASAEPVPDTRAPRPRARILRVRPESESLFPF